MATKVMMEALSPTMEEGRLAKWLKNEGDAVKNGETIAEVETDKAIMELVARADGVLRKRLLPENEAAPVGQLIAVIATPNETAGASWVPRTAAQSQGEASTPPQEKVASAPPPAGSAQPAPQASG